MSLYNLQSLFSITLKTKFSGLASASVTRILYKKPDDTEGFWNATVSGENLVYNIQEGDINMPGVWKFQAYIELGGLKGFGGIASKSFDNSLL